METKTEGLVLKATDYKDNDKLLTLFTPSLGKLTAQIRGVKKPKSKLFFAAQPFAFCEYVLAERGGRYTVVGAYLYDGFYGLRTDIERYYAACAVTEVCDCFSQTDGQNENLFVAAIEAIKELAMTDGDVAETLATFLLVALSEGGYMLDLDRCGNCGGDVKGNVYFDFDGGYFTCPSCAKGTRASEQTYEVLRKCAGLDYRENKQKGGRKKALRLLRTYMNLKTDSEYPCFGELIRLYKEQEVSEDGV